MEVNSEFLKTVDVTDYAIHVDQMEQAYYDRRVPEYATGELQEEEERRRQEAAQREDKLRNEYAEL